MDRLHEVAREIERRFPDARGYLKLARVYELTGDLDVGIAYGLRGYRLLTSQGAVPNQSTASQQRLVEDAQGQIAEIFTKIGDFDQASKFEPKPGIGQLFLRRRYRELVDLGQDAMLERPDDLNARYYLAFAYNATGDPANAERTLRNLGFPRPVENTLSGTEAQAVSYYIDALQALGGSDALVERLATAALGSTPAESSVLNSWWRNTLHACALVQLNRVPEAIAEIDRILNSQGLPSSPLLQDSLCFKRIAKEPRYIALIEHLNDRQRLLRERLPATLQKYGVADVQP
jgi:tetratricopeptide (TPR) repeat protein